MEGSWRWRVLSLWRWAVELHLTELLRCQRTPGQLLLGRSCGSGLQVSFTRWLVYYGGFASANDNPFSDGFEELLQAVVAAQEGVRGNPRTGVEFRCDSRPALV